jgi:predicted nucleic acid-binding protein
MSVVSNASPLINLAWIGKLDLLRQLYGELTIPGAVWQEVVVEGIGQPGADDVKAATWIKTQAVKNTESLCVPYSKSWMREKPRPLPWR